MCSIVDALLVEKTLSLELEDSGCAVVAFFNMMFWDKIVCTKVLLIIDDWNETAATLLRKCHNLKFQHYWQTKSRFLNGHSCHRRHINRNNRAILVADFYEARHFGSSLSLDQRVKNRSTLMDCSLIDIVRRSVREQWNFNAADPLILNWCHPGLYLKNSAFKFGHSSLWMEVCKNISAIKKCRSLKKI